MNSLRKALAEPRCGSNYNLALVSWWVRKNHLEARCRNIGYIIITRTECDWITRGWEFKFIDRPLIAVTKKPRITGIPDKSLISWS